jgi:plastocyanin
MSMRIPRCSTLLLLVTPATAAAANQCTLFSDLRAASTVTIQSMGNDYAPRCARVAAGTRVRFQSAFGFHPLLGGAISGGAPVQDPASPLGPWTNGTQYEVLIEVPAEYPYYCDFHWQDGMFGSLLVVPETFSDGFE